MEKTILICECHSSCHQIILKHDDEDDITFFEIHLSTHRNFFQRLWYGFRYAFGFKTNMGAWDEFLLSPEDYDKLIEHKKSITTIH